MQDQEAWDTLAAEGHQLSVLLVDDQQADRDLLCTYLSPHFQVVSLASGTEALEFCAEQRPDVILTDYRMNDMDGLSLIDELRRIPALRYVPMLMLSAYAAADVATHAFKAGADDYLNKDEVQAQHLTYAIKSAFLEKRVQEAADAERQALVERNLELERRHRLMTEYWLGIAHSVLNPLAATQEFVSLVMDGVAGPVTEEQGKYLALARGGCGSISHTIERLVKMADLAQDPGALSWSNQDLCIVIEDVLDDLRVESRRLGISIETEYDLAPVVLADKAALARLLHLLLRRCLWYVAQSGDIFVACNSANDEDKVRVTVSGRSSAKDTVSIEDHMEWQVHAALNEVNASDFVTSQEGSCVTYQFELVRFFDLGETTSPHLRVESAQELH